MKIKKRTYNNYSNAISKTQKTNLICAITQLEKELQPQKMNFLSKKYNIPYNTIKYWVLHNSDIVKRGKKRKEGGGRNGTIKYETELKWFEWLMDMRQHRAPVTADVFLAEIRSSFVETDLQVPGSQFVASRGYLTRYMDRWGLSLRVSNIMTPCSIIQGTSLQRNIMELWKCCFSLRMKFNIQIENIVNIDEVPVWFDVDSIKVLDKKGKKHVSIKSNGRDKKKITVVLAVSATGYKFPPLMIFETLGKDYFNLHDKFGNDLYFRTSDTRCSNEEIFLYYLDRLFCGNTHSLLLMDTSTTHGYKQKEKKVSGRVETFLLGRNIHVGIIPEHCTPIVQPLDTHINKIFKLFLKKGWATYMSENISEISRNGCIISNLNAAREVLCELVLESWKNLDPSLIVKSFKDNGLSLNLDGSEENLCTVHMKNINH